MRIHNIFKEIEKMSFETVLKIMGFYSIKTLNKTYSLFRKTHNNSGIKTSQIDYFSEDFAPFIEKMHDNHDFIYERSLERLNWRYCDLRGGKYTGYQAKHLEQTVGYIVYRVNSINPDNRQGFIVDFLVDKDYADAGYQLLHKAIDFFEEHNVNYVQAWVIEGH